MGGRGGRDSRAARVVGVAGVTRRLVVGTGRDGPQALAFASTSILLATQITCRQNGHRATEGGVGRGLRQLEAASGCGGSPAS
eukprot:scaffold2672_cov112-Isochrysis_galbana.AAC.6